MLKAADESRVPDKTLYICTVHIIYFPRQYHFDFLHTTSWRNVAVSCSLLKFLKIPLCFFCWFVFSHRPRHGSWRLVPWCSRSIDAKWWPSCSWSQTCGPPPPQLQSLLSRQQKFLTLKKTGDPTIHDTRLKFQSS